MNYKVYKHTKENKIFYIGATGNNKRPYDVNGRTKEWENIASGGFCVDIIKDGLTKSNALELERLIIEETDGLVNQFFNGYSSWNKGLKLSSTHIDNLKKKSANSKRVLDTKTGLKYRTIKDCAEAIGMNKGTLSQNLNGIRTNNTSIIYTYE